VVVVLDPQQPLVFVEEIVSGEAGCCVRLSSIVELDLVQLYETFDIPEDCSGFRLIAWQSPTAFTFSIEDRGFLLTGLGNRQVRIEEQPPTGNP
jgi:hypothetical protein